MWQYVWFTCQTDLLNQKKDKAEYETTDRGFRFLEHYYRVMELLCDENNKEHRRPRAACMS
jgi:predicted transcriptional regulator